MSIRRKGDTGVTKVYKYCDMLEEDKRLYEAECKALSALRMCLPFEILHIFNRYRSAKELWDALEKRFEGNVLLKKTLLKQQYAVFNGMRGESMDDIISRYLHLLAELEIHGVRYNEMENMEKLIDSLPAKWDSYTTTISENSDFAEMNLETLVEKLRARDVRVRRKETRYEAVQQPELYHAKSFSSSPGPESSSKGVTALYSGEEVGASSRETTDPNSRPAGTPYNFHNSVSGKVIEEHMPVFASIVSSYENYIQGKVSDPSLVMDDYNQLDQDDLEEMDIQWQLAMITIRAKRFMARTGKKIVGGKVGFDKSKVKCSNCDGFGHFARECQRPRTVDWSWLAEEREPDPLAY